MGKNSHKVLSKSYFSILEIIGGMKFTSREIDILACILEGRSTKKIASFLCLSPKTIENYLHNIRLRLECGSREGIRDFLEKSDKVLSLKIHYSFLVFRAEFERRLKDFSSAPEKKLLACRIMHGLEEENHAPLVSQIERYLKLAGMNTVIENPSKLSDLNSLIKELKEDSEKCTLCFLPKGLREGVANSDLLAHFEVAKISEEKTKDLDYSLILLSEGKKQRLLHIPKTFLLPPDEQLNTFLYLAEILNVVIPELHLEDLIKKLRQGLEKINPSETFQQSPADQYKNDGPQATTISAWKQRKWSVSLLVALLFLVCCGVYFTLPQSDKTKLLEASIRSDLVIPVQDAFLERSELITQLDEKFKGKDGIQTIALIGPGGAGKTTLARQYAHLQKDKVVWEINAETQESLTSSFESLAQALAKTAEDKKILMQIRNLQNPSEKEDRIILFVKEHLRKQENWFLVFDNVDSFTDIQKYFPHDAETWGQGKIILTTRDSTLQNNKSVNNAIQIGELTPQQKLVLFTKVIKQGNEGAFKPSQAEEVNQFLEKIPPYPLDVSVAAYYIKSTDTPYAAYLESLNSYHNEFMTIQERFLKENGDYHKTRYGIVSLSLQNLINTHKDFAELLLLISILDSQNIPINLLKKYKGDHATDNFIYNLKKYSLITNNSQVVSPRLIPTISIHRSTQAMALAYLEKNLTLKKTQVLAQGIVDTLVSYADTALEEQNLIMVKLLLNHYDRFLTYDNLLTESSKNAIRRELAYMYFGFGDFIKTKNHLESGLISLDEGYRKGDISVVRPLIYLGAVYRDLGNYEKSKEALENSLTLCKKNSELHGELGMALTYLGSTYRDSGNYEKAKDFLKQSLLVLKQNLPKNNLAYAEGLAFMGIASWFSGDYIKHRHYLEKSFTLYKKFFPENQLKIGWTCSHLASAYSELGYDERAKDFLRYSLAILAPYNISNERGYALLLLGNIYRKQGDYDKAKALIKEGIMVFQKAHPDNQIRLTEAFTHLGILQGEIGEYKAAKDSLNQSLMVYESKYGREHIQYGKVLGRLGDVYLREGDFDKAEELFLKSLVILKKNNHTDAYFVLENLADLYLKKSKLEADKGNTQQSEDFKKQANIYLNQSLQIVHTRFPKDSPHIIRIQNKLKSLDKK